MDMKMWDDFKVVLNREAIVDFRGERDLMPDKAVSALPPVGDAPIIKLTGEDTATAIWHLFDYVSDGIETMKGYGNREPRIWLSLAREEMECTPLTL